jgi:hypothetical protein
VIRPTGGEIDLCFFDGRSVVLPAPLIYVAERTLCFSQYFTLGIRKCGPILACAVWFPPAASRSTVRAGSLRDVREQSPNCLVAAGRATSVALPILSTFSQDIVPSTFSAVGGNNTVVLPYCVKIPAMVAATVGRSVNMRLNFGTSNAPKSTVSRVLPHLVGVIALALVAASGQCVVACTTGFCDKSETRKDASPPCHRHQGAPKHALSNCVSIVAVADAASARTTLDTPDSPIAATVIAPMTTSSSNAEARSPELLSPPLQSLPGSTILRI